MKKLLLLTLFIFCFICSKAQTAISAAGTAPDASAMLDVIATDKGLLIPRLSLTSTGVAAPVTGPATGLLVYNNNAAGDVTPGFYYWNGSAWSRLLNGSTNLSGAGTTNYLARWTPNGSTLGIGATQDDGTQVAIGTAPVAGNRLIVGPPTGANVMLINDINTAEWQIKTGGYDLSFANDFDDNGTYDTRLFLEQGGNAGIGTTAPLQKLEIGVNGGLGFSGTGLNSADKKLYSPADGDLEWMTHNSAGVHGFAVSHQGTKAVYLNISGHSYLNGGNVGIGTATPVGKLDVRVAGAGTWDRFVVKTSSLWGDGLVAPAENGGTEYVTIGAGGAAGIMISNPHVVWNAGNAAAAVRFGRGGGIASGEWWEAGVNASSGFHIRKNAVAATGIDILNNGNVGVGNTGPTEKLEVSGAIKMPGASATDNDSPALTLVSNDDFLYDAEYINHYAFGFHNFNDGAGLGANSYISGYYGVDLFTGGAQRFRINNNGTVKINNLAGTGTRMVTADATGILGAQALPGGVLPAGVLGQTLYHNGTAWTATSNLYNNGTQINLGQFTTGNTDEWPYVTWLRNTGASWDEGLIKGSTARGAWGRAGFGIHMDATRHFGFFSSGWDALMDIEGGTGRVYIKGNTGIGTTNPGAKLDIEGGAFLGYESTVSNFGDLLKSGFYQDGGGNITGETPDQAHSWQHLITARHSNAGNNHQMQIAGSYAVNDRLFFRKIAATPADNPAWNEFATRGTNTFTGNQTITGNLAVSGTITSGGTLLPTGTGAANRVTYWSGTNTLTSSGQFLYAGENLSVYDSESFVGEVRLGAAWGRPGVYSSGQLELFSGASYITFGNANVERMRLTAAGDLGIGTSTPSGKVHAAGSHANGIFTDGNDRPSIGATGNYPQMVLMSGVANGNHGATVMLGGYDSGNSGNHKHWSIGTAGNGATFLDIGYHAGTDLNPHAGVRNYNGSTFMTILNNGYVGIGTIAPVDKLDVRNSMSVNEIKFRNLDGGDDSDPYRLRKTQSGSNTNELQLQLNDDATERFAIYGNSCVGYGCGEYSSNLYHWFRADGYVYHAGFFGLGTQAPTRKFHMVDGQGWVQRARPNGEWDQADWILERTGGLGQFPSMSLHNPGQTAPQWFGSYGPDRLNAGSCCGGGWVTVAASGFTTISDTTMKKEIKTLAEDDLKKSLADIRRINSINYRYNNEISEDPGPYSGTLKRINPHIGFSAQTLPKEVVVDDLTKSAGSHDQGFILGYSLNDMDGLLVAGVKALDINQENQSKVIGELKSEIEDLKKLVSELEKKLNK